MSIALQCAQAITILQQVVAFGWSSSSLPNIISSSHLSLAFVADDDYFVLGFLCYCWMSFCSHGSSLHRVFTWFLLIVCFCFFFELCQLVFSFALHVWWMSSHPWFLFTKFFSFSNGEARKHRRKQKELGSVGCVNPVGNKASPSCSQCCNKKTWRCSPETGMSDHEWNRKTGDQTRFCTSGAFHPQLGPNWMFWSPIGWILQIALMYESKDISVSFYMSIWITLMYESKNISASFHIVCELV
jgi:hypothetical protein